jgi:hypothetical protein
VPQAERPDEAAAADFVGRETQVDFAFSGGLGGIDYEAECDLGRVVLEVTRFTQPQLLRDWDAAAREEEARPLRTGMSWLVTFQGYPHYSQLETRIDPALRDLETHGLYRFYRPDMEWWLHHVPTLAEALAILTEEHVVDARALDPSPEDAGSKLYVSPSGSWSFGGADSALAVLEAYLTQEERHLLKLLAEPASRTHLLVWCDDATPKELARALEDDRWVGQLPTRGPDLPQGVTDLWILHETTGHGWHWSVADGWVATSHP